jgi:hypothetical protein
VASRLIRWGTAALLGVGGVLVATLPPGPSPLELMWPRWDEPDRDPLDGAQHSVVGALNRAKSRLSEAEDRIALRRAAQLRRSPLVVRIDSGEVTVDEALTQRAEAHWRRADIPSGATPSILVARRDGYGGHVGVSDVVPGTCTVQLSQPYNWGRRRDGIASSGGRCLLEARFGPPGALVRAWVDSAYQLYIPDRAPRVPLVATTDADAQQWPEWLLNDARGSWSGWFRSRETLACAVGRGEFCPAAVGLPTWPSGDTRAWYSDRHLRSQLPAALLEELGPERFGELWRGDEGIVEGFERLSGTPFEPWAESFVQRRVGKIVRPTALDAGGWVAWIFWIGLLTGWLGVRLRAARAR